MCVLVETVDQFGNGPSRATQDETDSKIGVSHKATESLSKYLGVFCRVAQGPEAVGETSRPVMSGRSSHEW